MQQRDEQRQAPHKFIEPGSLCDRSRPRTGGNMHCEGSTSNGKHPPVSRKSGRKSRRSVASPLRRGARTAAAVAARRRASAASVWRERACGRPRRRVRLDFWMIAPKAEIRSRTRELSRRRAAAARSVRSFDRKMADAWRHGASLVHRYERSHYNSRFKFSRSRRDGG